MFETEEHAKAHLEELLRPFFWLKPEVHLAHPTSPKRLRIDYLAMPLPSVNFPKSIVGIEVKKGYNGDFRNFTIALHQCADYHDSVVQDSKTPKTNGQSIPFVFLYPPDIMDGYRLQTYQAGLEGGALRYAGRRDRVGVIREIRNPFSGVTRVRFELCGTLFWDSLYGERSDAERFATGHQVGSR